MTTRSKNVRVAFLILVAIVVLACGGEVDKPLDESQPNVVFILADDLGWSDLPVYGNHFNEAPNITRLAQDGMRFTDAYAACPVCSPTRASIQCGQYPARVGIIDFLPGHWRPYERLTVAQNRTQYLPQKVETLGELMKEAGYETGYFGKWHLGAREQNFPKNQGYDESVIFQGSPYYKFNEVMQPPQNFPEGKILSEALTDLGVSFIKKNKSKPFFLFLGHYDVHVQLNADSTLIQKYLQKDKVPGYPCNAIYAAMVEHIDNSVGSIVQALDSMGISDNTMVIFFSDNGGLVSRFDKIPLIADEKKYVYKDDSLLYIASSNAPLRAEKGTLYEGGIREPLIVKWPDKVEAGSISKSLISSVDFFPTFSSLVHRRSDSDQLLDGKSMIPSLRGQENSVDREIFWHYPVYHHSRPASAIRSGDWKLIYFYDTESTELYNLAEDIGEQNDLATENSEKNEELQQRLDQWLSEVGADLPVENTNFDEEKREEWGKHPGREALRAGEKL